ncbi:MAG: hypothetical protein R6U64_00250 [Bacteroidales bacterium]
MNPKNIYLIAVLLTIMILPSLTLSAQEYEHGFYYGGRIRTGYFTQSREDRDGTESVGGNFRLRLNLGAGYRLSPQWSVWARFGGRFSNDQESMKFHITDHIPRGSDGLPLGESTIDELYVNYQSAGGLNVRLGRMQTSFQLKGVPKKSLDREDSPNTDVNWTDGLFVSWPFHESYTLHVIAQYNAETWASNILRPPLDFGDDRSRISFFGMLDMTADNTAFVQRQLGVTWLPAALPVYGEPGEDLKDYLAATARAAAAWPVGILESEILVGGELGYAFNTPAKTVMNTSADPDDKAGNTAWQMSVNLMNILSKHSIGFVFGQIEDGYLISPDMRNNNFERELRMQLRLAKNLTMENRVRVRSDLNQIVGADQKRRDVDYYFRLSYRF